MSEKNIIDVLIVGGGVGGLTLAQWLTGLGRSWRIVERETGLGGALKDSDYPLKWIPALPEMTGRQYLAAMQEAISLDACYLACEVTSIEVADNAFICRLSQGVTVTSRNIVFACGASAYSPFSATPRIIVGAGLAQFNAIPGAARVAVLGGGDNALEHALLLQQRGCEVAIFARKALRASSAFLAQLEATNIAVHTQCSDLDLRAKGEKIVVYGRDYDYACVYYGYQPSPILLQFPQLIAKDSSLIAGVYALGDMTAPQFPNILLTQGQAAQMAKQIDFVIKTSN